MSILATDLDLLPTTNSPFVKGDAFSVGFKTDCSVIILDDSAFGEKSVSVSNSRSPIPSSKLKLSRTDCEDNVIISDSKYSKYDLMNASSAGLSSLTNSGKRFGSLELRLSVAYSFIFYLTVLLHRKQKLGTSLNRPKYKSQLHLVHLVQSQYLKLKNNPNLSLRYLHYMNLQVQFLHK